MAANAKPRWWRTRNRHGGERETVTVANAKPSRWRTRNRHGGEREPPGGWSRWPLPQPQPGVWTAAWAVPSGRPVNRHGEHHAKRSAWPDNCETGPCSNWRTTNNRGAPCCSDWLRAHQCQQSDQASLPSERERVIVAANNPTNPPVQPSTGTT